MQKPRLSLICALAEKSRLIGKDDRLLWRIPEDLKFYKEITTGKTVIMGRATFASLLGYYQRSGRALPQRRHIIITRDSHYQVDQPDCHVCHSVEAALELAYKIESAEIFVSGGEQIYRQTINLADRLYLTLVEGDFIGNKFFPDYSEFRKIVSERYSQTSQHKYKFVVLER